MTVHSAIMGGSKCHQRVHCPASAEEEAGHEDVSSEPARIGTAFHKLMEGYVDNALPESVYRCQDTTVDIADHTQDPNPPPDLIVLPGEKIKTKFWGAADALESLLLDTRAPNRNKWHVEAPVTLTKTCGEDVFGSMDLGYRAWGYGVVVDYKFGDGIQVDPKENAQLGFYAIGAMETYKGLIKKSDKFVEFVVIQPSHSGATLRTWEAPMDWLMDLRSRIQKAYKAIKEGTAWYATGPWCKWCRGAATCPEINQELVHIGKVIPKPSSRLTPIKWSALLDACDTAELAIRQIRRLAEDTAKRGLLIPGRKLVRTKKNRAWDDEMAAAKQATSLIGKKAFESSLRSPSQMAKAFEAENKSFEPMMPHITREDGPLKLVHASNKAPAALPEVSLPKGDVADFLGVTNR